MFWWATGIEDTFITEPWHLTGRTLDEYELTGHYERWQEDFGLVAELGRVERPALEQALNSGANVPVNDKPVIRYQQADYTVRLDNPEKAAKYAIQAIDALPGCGAKCSDKDKSNVVTSVYIMGRLFHILYATAHDDRYYQPAHDLYQTSLPKLTMDDNLRKQAQSDADTLEKTFKAMKAGVADAKARLFAHPKRPQAFTAGGKEQITQDTTTLEDLSVLAKLSAPED